MDSDARSIESFERDFEQLKELVSKVVAERANKGGKSAKGTSFEDHNDWKTSQVEAPLDEGTYQANDKSMGSSSMPSKKWTTTQKAT
eukprot:scaffold3895_cov1498-Pavlova_lutheri.AAC.1